MYEQHRQQLICVCVLCVRLQDACTAILDDIRLLSAV